MRRVLQNRRYKSLVEHMFVEHLDLVRKSENSSRMSIKGKHGVEQQMGLNTTKAHPLLLSKVRLAPINKQLARLNWPCLDSRCHFQGV